MTQQTTTNKIEWKEVALGNKEYFEILSSGINKFQGEKNYLSTESIKGTKIEKIECKITHQDRPSRANMQPILNSVWFAKMQSTLKVYSFSDKSKDETNNYILSTGFAGIKFDENISSEYVKFFLLSNRFNEEKDKLSTGSTQSGINNSFIVKIKIPLPFLPNNTPDLKEQERIVLILEKAEKLKERGKNAEKLLDEYLKSIFNEMFLKEKSNLIELGKVAPLQGGFAFKSKDYTSEGIKLVKITNVWNNILIWEDKTFLPNNYLEKYSQFKLKEGDIVLSMTRPIIKSLNSVKIVQIKKDDLPCLLNQRVGRFLIDENKILASYLLHYCYTSEFKREVNKYCSTSLQPNISSNQINSIKIPLPPLTLQQKFASIVEQVEKMKEEIKKTNANSEELFNSLMSKAFKGELGR
jgi:type I restriction enzyme S subunit